MIDLLLYWIYIALVVITAFIPGFTIATSIKRLNEVERLSISFGLSFLVIVILTPLFALGLDCLARFLFIFIFIISITQLCLLRENLKLTSELKFLILILIINFVSKFFIQTLWEYPVIGGDWVYHTLVVPYMFDIGNWNPPRDRTPLFNLLIYAYHHSLGTSLYQYWVSQIISVVANSVFILPAYLIAKQAFNDKIAKVSTAFMTITPFLIEQSIYTWPKNLAMYFVLLMIYFMFFSSKQENSRLKYGLAGFFGALGFLTHNYTTLYILTALIVLVYKFHKYTISHRFTKHIVCFIAALTTTVIPYYLWVYLSYGTLLTSRFIYYPFAVEGYESVLYGEAKDVFETFFSTPITHIIGIRISNAVVTLTPAALPINPIATRFPTYNPIFYYSHEYPGALSSIMYILVVVWFLKYLFKKTETDTVLAIFVIVPFLLFLILIGWKGWGLLSIGLHPSVPILIMFGFNELYKFGQTWLLLILVFIDSFIENVIYWVLIIKFYYIEGGLDNIAREVSRFIPDFQISKLISAHFLLNTLSEFYINLTISLFVIFILTLYLKKIAIID